MGLSLKSSFAKGLPEGRRLGRRHVGRGYLQLLAFATVTSGACDAWGPRVYTAQAYDPDASCLAGYAPIGLVEADELGALCEPVCLRLDETLYVSTVCPPYPTDALVEDPESSADCSLALGLLDAEAFCDDEAESPDASTDAAE